MIVDVQQLDDFVYILEGSELDYLLLVHGACGSYVSLHLVQAFHGTDGFFEFGEETFSTKMWIADAAWLDNVVYSVVQYLIREKEDPENPRGLYHLLGGFLRSPPTPNLIPYSLVN